MNRQRAPRLSLDLLRAFRSAARHLSFTRAAREQFVTQSAVSRAMRTLEEQLGQPLFHRVNRALTLTHAGEELYRASDEALGLIDAATDRLTGSARALAFTTTTALASTWLVPKLPQFTRLHPGTDVRIFASNDMVDLEREHIDVALRFVPPGADAPNGRDGVAHIGGLYLVVARNAVGRESVEAFVAWLRNEVQRDEARAPVLLRAAKRSADVRASQRSARYDQR